MNWPTFEPLIPSSLWLALAAGGAVLLGWYARRRPGMIRAGRWAWMIALMAGAMGAVLVVLLNPTWVERVPPPEGKPVLTVLVDATASMGTRDGANNQTRYAVAAEMAQRAAKDLGKRFDVRVKLFGKAVMVVDPASLVQQTPEAMSTDLAGALAAGPEGDRPQGQAMLLLSDGIHNAGGSGAGRVLESLRAAKAIGVPVYTRTLGGDHSQLDIALEVRSSQDLAFIHQRVPLAVRVKQTGASANVKTTVTLMHERKEVAKQEVEIPPGKAVDVQFPVGHEKPGLYAYEVKASPLAEEVSQGNNSASYLLRVVNEPLRVLVLEGKPYWDSKFLLRTLAADPAVSLDCVVKMAPGRYMRRTLASASDAATAPATKPAGARAESWAILADASDLLASAEKLRQYQIVVLGRDAETYLTETAVNQLQNWIGQDGGSLVCYRGAPAAQIGQKLARILPVKWSPTREARVRMRLTERGKDLAWARSLDEQSLAMLPSLAVGAQMDTSKALAEVLATAATAGSDEGPAAVYQPYGSGRVVVLEGAGMWRWAFLPPSAQQGDEVYGGMWRGLLRWLISGVGLLPGQKMALRSDKVTFDAGENASVMLLMKDETGAAGLPRIELAGESGKAAEFTPVPVGDEPGSYRVSFGKLAEGRYEARVAGSAADSPGMRTMFSVRVLSDEQINLAARPDLMKQIAQETGGVALASEDVGEVAKRFDEYVEKVRPAAVRRMAAWDRWWVLLGVLGLWTVTWGVRRRSGLV